MLAEHLHHAGDPEALPTRMQVNPRFVRLELDRHREKEQRAKHHTRTGVALLHGRPCTPRHCRAHPAVVERNCTEGLCVSYIGPSGALVPTVTPLPNCET